MTISLIFPAAIALTFIVGAHSFSQPSQLPTKICGCRNQRSISPCGRVPIFPLLAQPDDVESSLSSPFDRPVLAAVDATALLVFAGIGKASHSPDGSLDIGAVVLTAAPFVASWLLTSPITGVYSPDDRQTNLIKGTVIKASKGWAVAVPLGCVLRGLIKGYAPPLPFVIVTLIATLVILSVARIVFSLAEDFFVELVN